MPPLERFGIGQGVSCRERSCKHEAGFTPGFFACAIIFPGNDQLALPFPPIQVSGNVSLEAENMAALFNIFTSKSIRRMQV
jgi:hypothetical protein